MHVRPKTLNLLTSLSQSSTLALHKHPQDHVLHQVTRTSSLQQSQNPLHSLPNNVFLPVSLINPTYQSDKPPAYPTGPSADTTGTTPVSPGTNSHRTTIRTPTTLLDTVIGE